MNTKRSFLIGISNWLITVSLYDVVLRYGTFAIPVRKMILINGIMPKSPIQSCLFRDLCTPLLATGLNIETSYSVRTSLTYAHQILSDSTCFQMTAILVIFFDLLSCPYRQSQRLHIACTCISPLYLHTQKE